MTNPDEIQSIADAIKMLMQEAAGLQSLGPRISKLGAEQGISLTASHQAGVLHGTCNYTALRLMRIAAKIQELTKVEYEP